MKFILLVFLFMSLANPITGGKLFPGFNNPEKWMKRVIRKLQRKSGAYGQMIASNTAGISNNAGFISSIAACDMDYINDPDYGLSCCFEDTNNLGQCLCNGTTIDDTANPGSCCSANLKHPDHCLCSGTDMDNPNNPGNCCFKDSANPGQCLCNAANYTDDPNKRCFNLDWKGDGVCDDENNHGGCDFDGGDCCGEDVDTDLCTVCQCLEEEAPLPNAVGCCFEDTNNPGQCLCSGNDIDDPDNAGSCCVEDPDIPGTCCVDSIACNGQGSCSSGNSGLCDCDSGFTGDRCNITTCPGSGGKVCSGNGNCPASTVCDCQAGFHGDDCATYCVAPTTCSGQGACGLDGICQCIDGKKGADCTEDALPSDSGVLLFAAGQGTAICEVISTKTSCPATNNLPDYPLGNVYLSNGAVLDGVVIMCGGYVTAYQDKCYKFDENTNSWVLLATLPKARMAHRAVPLTSMGALWLEGGKWTQNGYWKETDLVFLNGTVVPGPTMPTPRLSGCAVELHDGRVLIMGSDGSGTGQKTTLFWDPVSDSFEVGQEMNQNRKESGCALFTSPLHGDRPVVLIVGGQGLNKAELLDYTVTETWEEIQSVPSGAAQGCYAVPTPHGAILQNGQKFYELTCDSSACSWATMPYEASVSRNRGVLMWLPPSFTPSC